MWVSTVKLKQIYLFFRYNSLCRENRQSSTNTRLVRFNSRNSTTIKSFTFSTNLCFVLCTGAAVVHVTDWQTDLNNSPWLRIRRTTQNSATNTVSHSRSAWTVNASPRTPPLCTNETEMKWNFCKCKNV